MRTHNCGELRIDNVGSKVVLCGWVQRVRDKGGMVWVDLRDRYGITQLIAQEGEQENALLGQVRELGREFVIMAKGTVEERFAKNPKLPTGDIEIRIDSIDLLNASKLPPFLIEDETDGGEDLRMKYRYLDLRRAPVRNNLQLRHQLSSKTRQYLDQQNFIEVETPYLIKSTPEGARDFIVPSRINQGEFYALPQSPQTFKQLLMVSGFDRYYQIVKCFRDEDLRADRQPEFTQIDCEMAFVNRDDVLNTFEGLIKFLFKEIKNIELPDFPHMSYDDAIRNFGSDKPDTRFGMQFIELNALSQDKGFNVFDSAELVVGICVEGAADFTRKQLDTLTDFVRKPQIGAKGLVWSKYNADGTYKSSVDKFYTQEDIAGWFNHAKGNQGDLLLILAGDASSTRNALSDLRLHLGRELGLMKDGEFNPLWVIDFPLVEWDEESQRYHAMHHPFTSPHKADLDKIESDPASIRANAYDLVINGVEIGGGSIRIHDRGMQQQMFKLLGFTPEEAEAQFGFLMNAFEYGAPPHGGIAFGFDRLCAMFGGQDSIRDFIAFPKNNSGRDVMIDSPAAVDLAQLNELGISLKK